ncbi:hypothetical protein O6H91_Y296600 [Diphasiastrum complanatum]|nr:hypothetical protein O6H91_Y296600 [Diphasiastrum complanatum]
MEEQQFQLVDHNIDLESDLDKILQFLVRDEPFQRSARLVPADDSACNNPKVAFEPPWVLTYDEQPSAFVPQFLPSDSAIPVSTLSSPLLALQRELLCPYTSDLATSSITEDILGHGVLFQERNATYDSSSSPIFPQQLLNSDDERQRLNQMSGLDCPGLLRLISLPQYQQAGSSPGLSYPTPPSSLQPSWEVFHSFTEMLEGGGGPAVVTTPNSSLSSSVSEEAVDEETSHPVASYSRPDDMIVTGSKRKLAPELTSIENLASMPDSKKQNKSARKGKKRVREPRYAIQTRSDKDVLEDGYKWRKYGQKTVKNSPHPSYYRCTYNKCSVKKTVERSCEDSGLVITTYEGVHNHPSPTAIRSSSESLFLDTIIPFSRPVYSQLFAETRRLPSPDQRVGFDVAMQIRGARQLPQMDRGLLEDMVPSTIRMTST